MPRRIFKIKLNKCALRNWMPRDAKHLAQHANNINIWDNLRDEFPHPYTLENARQWIEIANIDDPLTNFAITLNDKAIGGIGILKQTDIFRLNAEIGYWLSEDYWNRGIASEALKAMVDYSFESFKLTRLFANVFDTNSASIKVLEKTGFELEASIPKSIVKNDKLIDRLVYSIRK